VLDDAEDDHQTVNRTTPATIATTSRTCAAASNEDACSALQALAGATADHLLRDWR
jgi:hypothetical protein